MHKDEQEYRQEAVGESLHEKKRRDNIITSSRHNISRSTHSFTLLDILQSDVHHHRLGDAT